MKTITPKPKSFGKKSSFTAYGVAYRRTFTNIPFSAVIFNALCEIRGPLSAADQSAANNYPNIIPFFEARYKMTDLLLAQSGVSQVLELASGLSPRGLVWTRSFPEMKFVEFDLPDEIELKGEILQKITGGKDAWSNNLFFHEGDVRNSKDFAATLEMFDKQPVGIICEGLLRYMSFDDKAKLARNIKKCLAEKGGVWITPDIETLAAANSTPDRKKRYARVAKKWNMDVRPNLFKDKDHVYAFFQSFGFKITENPHIQLIPQLVSPHRLGLKKAAVIEELKHRTTFVMSL